VLFCATDRRKLSFPQEWKIDSKDFTFAINTVTSPIPTRASKLFL